MATRASTIKAAAGLVRLALADRDQVLGVTVSPPPRSKSQQRRTGRYGYALSFARYRVVARKRDGALFWRNCGVLAERYVPRVTAESLAALAQSIAPNLQFDPTIRHNGLVAPHDDEGGN